MSARSRRQNRQKTFGHTAWMWAPDNHNAAVQRRKARKRWHDDYQRARRDVQRLIARSSERLAQSIAERAERMREFTAHFATGFVDEREHVEPTTPIEHPATKEIQ